MQAKTTLRRLQIAHLFFGMMFWYGIEQLFLNKYLHSSSARGFLTVAFTASLLVFDIPCGIIADKIGRKNSLLLGCVAQAIGLLVLASSTTLAQYIVGSVIFGIFISFMNGAAQALLYDHLQLNSLAGSYGKQQGLVYAMFLAGAGIANLASGLIAHSLGLRAPYYLSLIPCVLSAIVLWPIVEPPLSKQANKWYVHLGEVVRQIAVNPRILVFGTQFIVSELVLLTIGEFGQIYILSFHVSTVALGLLWALVAGFAAIGRLFAHHAGKWPRTTIAAYCAALLVFIVLHSWIGIVLYLVVYGYNEAVANISETEVQDATASSVRATLFSTVSFAGNLVAIPLVFLFNHLYVHSSIFAANRLMAIVAICVLTITILLAKYAPKRTPLENASI